MIIPRDEIARLIPHSGAMCLLDGVRRWDATAIRCFSTRHRAADNPLRYAGRLGALCGVEFAAQAMAVHGRLCGAVSSRPRAGYLVGLRGVVCRCDRLDRIAGELVIDAAQIMGNEAQVIYSFSIGCAARELLSGRATVLLEAASP